MLLPLPEGWPNGRREVLVVVTIHLQVLHQPVVGSDHPSVEAWEVEAARLA